MADINEGRALGWEDGVEQESSYVLLPKGDYDFMVINIERGYFNGSEKMPACNMATVHIKITDPASGQDVIIYHRIYLNTKVEWKLSEFFIALGLKKHGEPVSLRAFGQITGRRGRCKIDHREYNGQTFNDIKKFYDPAEQPTQGGSYTAGTF